MGCCNTKNHSNVNHCAENPCAVTQSNTAACESLPSQIQNFSDQFFGAVIKTEVDGVVSWSLPCNLDTGLTNNPRASDEGLACYFLRLFEEGIIGLTGPAGATGEAGEDGRNAYTVTLQSFEQPGISNPNGQLLTQFNPGIIPGLDVFIAGSGWYSVTGTDGNGVLFLTLNRGLPNVPEGSIVSAGKLVVPSGISNPGVAGPAGPQGPAGATGPAGTTPLISNGFYFTNAGTNYNLTGAYAQVGFITSDPEVLLPTAGTYLITAVIDLVGLAGVATSDIADCKLRDNLLIADISGSEHSTSNFINTERRQIFINVIFTTASNSTPVIVLGRATSPGVIAVVAAHTTISFTKLA